MTRFEMNLAGRFGEYWKKDAMREIERMQTRANNDEILTDANGAAYWESNGRYIPEDCAQMLAYTDFDFSVEATTKARDAQTEEFLASYRRNHRTTDEERMEARAAFGEGVRIVNVITGELI